MMNSKEKIIGLIVKGLDGKLNLEELYAEWPEQLEGEFWDNVFRNLESGVEHFPYGIVSRKPDYEMWHRSSEYNALVGFLDIIKKKTFGLNDEEPNNKL